MTFRVGMKVVLVNDGGWDRPSFHTYPRKGVVYTIRDLCMDVDGDLCIRVDEIANGLGICAKTGEVTEPCWLARRFRPVISPEQKVSFTTGAPVDSERWDNRVQGSPQKAVTALQS